VLLVGSDGGVFTFGDATYEGSKGGQVLAAPVVGIVATANGGGYGLAGANGSVYLMGDAGGL